MTILTIVICFYRLHFSHEEACYETVLFVPDLVAEVAHPTGWRTRLDNHGDIRLPQQRVPDLLRRGSHCPEGGGLGRKVEPAKKTLLNFPRSTARIVGVAIMFAIMRAPVDGKRGSRSSFTSPHGMHGFFWPCDC